MKRSDPAAPAGTWALVFALTLVPPAAEAENEATIRLVGTCVACHGADGIGKAPQYPNLRGQKAAYLEAQLKAFRSGDRKGTDMNALAKGLSDEDIEALAAYFAKMGCS